MGLQPPAYAHALTHSVPKRDGRCECEEQPSSSAAAAAAQQQHAGRPSGSRGPKWYHAVFSGYYCPYGFSMIRTTWPGAMVAMG